VAALVVLTFGLPACGSDDKDAQSPTTAPVVASAHSRVRQFSVSYQLNGTARAGTLFEWRRGDLRCAAGFVSSLQSRVFANSGELEFWCRRSRDLPVGPFKRLPKPDPAATQSRVANLDGRLIELDSQSVYGRHGWRPLPGPAGLARIYTAQRVGDHDVITGSANGCAGLSVWVDDTYRGTITVAPGAVYSAVTVVGDVVWINLDGDTRRGTVPQTPAAGCREIALDTVNDGAEYIYGYQPFRTEVVYGGTSNASGCASFYRSGVSLPVFLDGAPCAGQRITEWYSFTRDRHGLLIGEYPEGTLMRYADGRVTDTGLARPDAEDWVGPDGTHYRESQSIVSSAGLLMVGLYPWSEILTVDQEGRHQTRRRLLDAPAKSPAVKLPYFEEATRFAVAQPDIGPDLTLPDGTSLREDPRYLSTWGERVPTIAVFNGRVCASTGNLGGARYDPELHPYLPPDLAARYGTVFCAPLANQTMSAGSLPAHGRLRFVISDGELRVYLDGQEIAHHRHQLRSADLELLRQRGELELGRGPYGDLEGTARRD
jgi:hypothetical protein